MDFYAWAKRIHESAIVHGWLDKPISDDEYAALFHSEISAAFEAYRKGMPDVYWECEITNEMCAPTSKYDCDGYGDEHACPYHGLEPCGVAIELVDLMIRILDYAYTKGWDLDSELGEYSYSISKDHNFVQAINILHGLVADIAYEKVALFGVREVFAIAEIIENYCVSKGVDFETLLRLKLEYEKTHGGLFK